MAACQLGVCYYPEHWSKSRWAEDAQKMVDLGLKQVRIGEFAWSRIEPKPGQLVWGWLDEAVETLGEAGLTVMMGTPTATPPKWLIDAHPDILACDQHGHPRRFGSRRHYCFSSRQYVEESRRIVDAMAARYGANPTVAAWQTDNEYGCHDTVRSYSPEAASAFRAWLKSRYLTPEVLNEAWGTVFWSQEYRSFEEVDLPNLTVTEPNPSHALDFYRFSSDQVVSYNRMQVDLIRKHAPEVKIVHNYMGFYFNFDHYEVAEDLDGVGWDSYPLGFLDQEDYAPEDKARYMRQGHPDFAAFFHDLYRACGRGHWQVLEQQPGPVNWAPHNTAPLPGMVRLWTLEAAAHGAEAVKYFRWRQAPFAQEQMHAGIERPDYQPALAAPEVRQAAADLAALNLEALASKGRLGLVFSYDATWLFEAQPQGRGWAYTRMAMDWYGAARRLGLNIDILPPSADHSGYDVILVPSLPVIPEGFVQQVEGSGAIYLFGPRTGSKTESLTIPEGLPPGALKHVLPIKVTHVESFAPHHRERGSWNGQSVETKAWLDHVSSDLTPAVATPTGDGLLYQKDNVHYFTSAPEAAFLEGYLQHLCALCELGTCPMPEGLRVRRHGGHVFAFNYAPAPVMVPATIRPKADRYVLGGMQIPPAGVSVWKDEG